MPSTPMIITPTEHGMTASFPPRGVETPRVNPVIRDAAYAASNALHECGKALKKAPPFSLIQANIKAAEANLEVAARVAWEQLQEERKRVREQRAKMGL